MMSRRSLLVVLATLSLLGNNLQCTESLNVPRSYLRRTTASTTESNDEENLDTILRKAATATYPVEEEDGEESTVTTTKISKVSSLHDQLVHDVVRDEHSNGVVMSNHRRELQTDGGLLEEILPQIIEIIVYAVAGALVSSIVAALVSAGGIGEAGAGVLEEILNVIVLTIAGAIVSAIVGAIFGPEEISAFIRANLFPVDGGDERNLSTGENPFTTKLTGLKDQLTDFVQRHNNDVNDAHRDLQSGGLLEQILPQIVEIIVYALGGFLVSAIVSLIATSLGIGEAGAGVLTELFNVIFLSLASAIVSAIVGGIFGPEEFSAFIQDNLFPDDGSGGRKLSMDPFIAKLNGLKDQMNAFIQERQDDLKNRRELQTDGGGGLLEEILPQIIEIIVYAIGGFIVSAIVSLIVSSVGVGEVGAGILEEILNVIVLAVAGAIVSAIVGAIFGPEEFSAFIRANFNGGGRKLQTDIDAATDTTATLFDTDALRLLHEELRVGLENNSKLTNIIPSEEASGKLRDLLGFKDQVNDFIHEHQDDLKNRRELQTEGGGGGLLEEILPQIIEIIVYAIGGFLVSAIVSLIVSSIGVGEVGAGILEEILNVIVLAVAGAIVSAIVGAIFGPEEFSAFIRANFNGGGRNLQTDATAFDADALRLLHEELRVGFENSKLTNSISSEETVGKLRDLLAGFGSVNTAEEPAGQMRDLLSGMFGSQPGEVEQDVFIRLLLVLIIFGLLPPRLADELGVMAAPSPTKPKDLLTADAADGDVQQDTLLKILVLLIILGRVSGPARRVLQDVNSDDVFDQFRHLVLESEEIAAFISDSSDGRHLQSMDEMTDSDALSMLERQLAEIRANPGGGVQNRTIIRILLMLLIISALSRQRGTGAPLTIDEMEFEGNSTRFLQHIDTDESMEQFRCTILGSEGIAAFIMDDVADGRNLQSLDTMTQDEAVSLLQEQLAGIAQNPGQVGQRTIVRIILLLVIISLLAGRRNPPATVPPSTLVPVFVDELEVMDNSTEPSGPMDKPKPPLEMGNHTKPEGPKGMANHTKPEGPKPKPDDIISAAEEVAVNHTKPEGPKGMANHTKPEGPKPKPETVISAAEEVVVNHTKPSGPKPKPKDVVPKGPMKPEEEVEADATEILSALIGQVISQVASAVVSAVAQAIIDAILGPAGLANVSDETLASFNLTLTKSDNATRRSLLDSDRTFVSSPLDGTALSNQILELLRDLDSDSRVAN